MSNFYSLQTVGSDGAEVQRWHELLDRLLVTDLTGKFLDRVLQIPSYRQASLPTSEIRRTAVTSFAALIQSLRHGVDSAGMEAERLRIATDVGVSRARAGIPIESLMSAIRLDFSVLWSELTAHAEEADAALLVRHAETVWRVVDSYASQTQAIYMAEQQRILNEATAIRQGYVAAVFGPVNPTTEMLDRVANELGFRPDTPLDVAVAVGAEATQLRVVIAHAARRGYEIFTHPQGDALVAFWPVDERPGSAVRESAEEIRRLRCGLIENVPGLPALASSARIAGDLARLIDDRDEKALTLKRAWARIARMRLAEAGIPIAADVDTALARCGGAERERLVEAVRAYAVTGSVGAASEQLFCHRNTLMNRLRRFRELTGIDVMIPDQIARLIVAWS
ncbi:helix-turn-helix domain-containing protein [Paeniglutamicibacter antarcticus]|uniref:Helix-turn-helix domain-containing protein n=1 Tax=Arthrobacter terrae TaxID=2935737 RepID=A0A931CU83_9MICC|nr:helix-turn-helix domain-containing protein [Arthrobacter terrae]MBG0741039.1 helix-turn-helix domain-containing protein [Arthrobacter terrae]